MLKKNEICKKKENNENAPKNNVMRKVGLQTPEKIVLSFYFALFKLKLPPTSASNIIKLAI